MDTYKKTIYYFLCGLIISFLFVGGRVSAASVTFQTAEQSYGLQGEVVVEVMLDSEEESINAIDGTILYDPEMLEFKKAADDKSIISYWLERPEVISKGVIEFSGVIPGGFEGVLSPNYKGVRPGNLITLFFKTKKSGPSTISIGASHLLRNDGEGTAVPTTAVPLTFSISSTTGSFIVPKVIDKERPEEFTPEISRSPMVFDGKWFVVFNTNDRESGINHYEIEESDTSTPTGKWQIVESPYVLKDQKLASYIFIKAVDNEKNERIATINPSTTRDGSFRTIVSIIVLLMLILISIAWLRRSYAKKTH